MCCAGHSAVTTLYSTKPQRRKFIIAKQRIQLLIVKLKNDFQTKKNKNQSMNIPNCSLLVGFCCMSLNYGNEGANSRVHYFLKKSSLLQKWSVFLSLTDSLSYRFGYICWESEAEWVRRVLLNTRSSFLLSSSRNHLLWVIHPTSVRKLLQHLCMPKLFLASPGYSDPWNLQVQA